MIGCSIALMRWRFVIIFITDYRFTVSEQGTSRFLIIINDFDDETFQNRTTVAVTDEVMNEVYHREINLF